MLSCRARAAWLMLAVITFLPGVVSVAGAAQLLRHDAPEFSCLIPDNFQPLPASLQPESWVYGFGERTGLRDEPKISFGIEILAAPLPQSPPRDAAALYPESVTITPERFAVIGEHVQGSRIVLRSGNVTSVQYHVPIPVKGRAVRLIIGAVIEKEIPVRQTLAQILKTFSAASSWRQTRIRRLYRRYALFGAGLIAAMIVAGRRRMRRGRRDKRL